ncbi:hypothetical protein CDV36_011613 [Fusarium kuroshium]|uniref:Nephrocystin 3-like N-terminal domain-containing protein n=1 Tax=Fusarium kuroshium TaxID=2010991 RepID=A0A3M2RTZ4_9HYPO|nr:hypothetical protein CDV36_011613 [Fusarium kuroshium]
MKPHSVSKEPPDGVFGKKAVRFDLPEQEESTADQGSPIIPKLEKKPTRHMMMNHIAGHLQFLALLTPRLSTKNLADGEDIDFASSQAPSGDSNSGERSTLDDEFEHKEGQETWNIDIQETISGKNPVRVLEESIAPQDEDIPPTEPMDWALFSPRDPPQEGDEDKVLKHIRESLLEDAANHFAKINLPTEASEAAETLARLLRQGDPRTNFGGLVQFDEDLTRESLYQFFNTSLSSVDDGVYATLANHCMEEVWGVDSIDGLFSRRVLFGLLLKCQRPLDILRFIVAGLLDHDLPLSTGTLESLFPFWDDQVLGVFLDSYTTYETWGHLPRIPVVSQPSSATGSYPSLNVQGPYSPPQTSDGSSPSLWLEAISSSKGFGPMGDNTLETPDQEIQSRQNDMGLKFVQYPYATDLGVIKAQFEDSAGSLPRGVCSWIFEDVRFRKFLADPQPQMLWIHGVTGRGKTMLLCGIIDGLRETTDKAISYSFFRRTNSGIISTTAVVRELIHHLVVERPWLLKYVQESYELSGKTLSGDLNSLEDFFYVLQIILSHASMTDTVLIIDDAHERTTEVGTLLRLIANASQIPSKLILSSHSSMSIMDFWGQSNFEKIDLNLARGQISQAISAYASYRVDSLAARKHHEDSLRRNLYEYLVSNAYGNFLWVSMVCRNLEHTPPEDGLLAHLSHQGVGFNYKKKHNFRPS